MFTSSLDAMCENCIGKCRDWKLIEVFLVLTANKHCIFIVL